MPVFRRNTLPLLLSILLLTALAAPLPADIAYIINKPSGDPDVSITFTYDPEAESELLETIKEDGHILLWQIQSGEQYVFYRPFQFTQGRFSVRPVMCLVEKYQCQSSRDECCFVYRGYLFLESVFDLSSPFNITLADKMIRATFIQ